jgi:CRP-like cAMP-binding protein
LKTTPAFDALFKRLVSRALDASQNRIYSVISGTAEEKYRQFQQRYPDLIGRVPLYMIASYLGLTRETLTRIRQLERQ